MFRRVLVTPNRRPDQGTRAIGCQQETDDPERVPGESGWRRETGLALAVLGAAAAVFLARLLTWPATLGTDAWAYTAWAKALLRGESPLFGYLPTTPKPLAVALAVLASPIPAERAFGVVVALALAGLVASLFTAGSRRQGAVAGVVAVGAFASVPHLNEAIAFGFVDAVSAALLLCALALAGKWRLGCLILAGLLRPEVWLLSALVGATETRGSVRRRVAAAAFCGALPAALWSASDLATTGDPLATMHRAQWIIAAIVHGGFRPPAWPSIPGLELHAIAAASGTAVAIAGAVGLVVHTSMSWRRGSLDPLLPGATTVWTLATAIEMSDAPTPHRYFLSLAALLALGCGLLAGGIVRGARDAPAIGAVAAIAVLIAATITMAYPHAGRSAQQAAAVSQSVPAIDRALGCGNLRILGLVPRDQSRRVIYLSELAARTNHSIRYFVSRRGAYGELLRIRGTHHALPPWPRIRTPLGTLALSPRCQQASNHEPSL